MSSDDFITINDVGPRDGLQAQKNTLTVEQRIALIRLILDTGIRNVEVGSFVSPTAVPAMAHTDAVLAPFLDQSLYPSSGYEFSVLIPNTRGYHAAVAAGAKTVNFVVCSTDSMNKKNVGKSVDQLLTMLAEVSALAATDGVAVNAYLATCWDCPFDGNIPESAALALAQRIIDTGVKRLILSDSIGSADPNRVSSIIKTLAKGFALDRIGCHFHDTRSFALANVYASIEAGVRLFDSSIGGLGGCPFAPGASGNLATEDLHLLVSQLGFKTNVVQAKLIATIQNIQSQFPATAEGGKTFAWQVGQLEAA